MSVCLVTTFSMPAKESKSTKTVVVTALAREYLGFGREMN